MRQRLFSTLTVFMYGSSDSGKSILAEAVIEYICRMLGWQVARLVAKNALDDYEGQEVVFLDNVRDGEMDAETWLGFLDPHHESSAAACYYNKLHVTPRLVVITSNTAPIEMFFFARRVGKKGNNVMSKDMDTSVRRIGAFLTVEDMSDVGPYNVLLQVPRRGDAYRYELASDRDAYDQARGRFVDRWCTLTLRWRFESAIDDGGCLSIYGAALELLLMLCEASEIDASVIDLTDGKVVTDLFETVNRRMLKPSQKGQIPLLPVPSSNAEFRGKRPFARADDCVDEYERNEDASTDTPASRDKQAGVTV